MRFRLSPAVTADDNEDGEEECAGVLEICQLDHVKFAKWVCKHVIEYHQRPVPIWGKTILLFNYGPKDDKYCVPF